MSTKQERRRERLEAERLLERQQAIETPRHPHDEQWGYWGVGGPWVQLIHRPARTIGVCYEVRGVPGNLRLFRSRSTRPGGELVVGHERVAAKPSFLYRMLRELDEIQVPLRALRGDYGVLDGERFELATFAGMGVAARLAWYAGPVAPGWEPLVQFTTAHIMDFDSRDAIEDESSA